MKNKASKPRKKLSWKDLVVNYSMTGPLEINVEAAAELWDSKCFLAQWGFGDSASYRFVRYRRLGQQATTHKFTMRNEQALELIEKLGLQRTQEMFNSAGSWKKPE